jgi:hypothetical protein
VDASRRLGIGLFRMHVELEQLLEESAAVVGCEPVPAVAAAQVAAATSVPLFESEPCAKCGGRNVHRSKAKGMYERFRKLHTPERPFRCDDCDWRGWLLPLEHTTAIDGNVETDLRSLDAAFSPLAPLGEAGRPSER